MSNSELTDVASSRIHGVGLFASRNLKRGDLIFRINGPIVRVTDFLALDETTYRMAENWIGVSRYRYIDTKDSPIRLINHSCKPNAAIPRARELIASAKIAEGEEVTIDYSFTEAGQDYKKMQLWQENMSRSDSANQHAPD